MPDREKVIRELKAARLFFEMGSNRADGVVGNLGCKSGMKYIDDALELLKEQEAKAPSIMQDVEGIWATCPTCGNKLRAILAMEMDTYFPKYCQECGQAVKWE